MAERKLAVLKYGTVYKNRGGGEFMCVSPPWLPYPAGEARMTNVKNGWTFRAHGTVQYPDGTIEWDYSTGGYFNEGRRRSELPPKDERR